MLDANPLQPNDLRMRLMAPLAARAAEPCWLALLVGAAARPPHACLYAGVTPVQLRYTRRATLPQRYNGRRPLALAAGVDVQGVAFKRLDP